MPPRKSHKKSRAGCQRCKTRKIKCDELHPVCGNCDKHGVACDFSDPAAHASPSDATTPRSSSAHSSTDIVVKQSPALSSTFSVTPLCTSIDGGDISRYSGTSRMLELRLLHTYTAKTSKTLAATGTEADQNVWTVDVTGMAFETPCLLDTILSVAALHLRFMCPQDQSLIRAYHGYMASAISQYSSLLVSGLDASNAEALFATSALIAFQAVATRQFTDDIADGSTYSLPLQWFHAFQGVKVVVMAGWKYLRDSERVGPIIRAQPPISLDFNPVEPAFLSFLLDGLDDQLVTIPDSTRSATQLAYQHAVAFLNWAHQKPDRARVLGFPSVVSRRFVTLIEQHDPRSLVIISCFFAMTKVVEGDMWWLQGVGEREVKGILTLLPQEWKSKMAWPLGVITHQGPMNQEIWGCAWIPHSQTREPDKDIHEHIDIMAFCAARKEKCSKTG